jgi:hypothetical protein
MDVATFRRYLQPSPTLRWHPWAPLAVLLLACGFVFWLGLQLGVLFAERRSSASTYAQGWFEVMLQKEQLERPSAAVVRRAHIIDNAIEAFVRDDQQRGLLIRAIDEAIESTYPRRVADARGSMRNATVRAAEWRLANFTLGAPAWEKTSTYCRDYRSRDYPGHFDVTAAYERSAAAYSTLLGRKVTAAQLAPAIPGGECK